MLSNSAVDALSPAKLAHFTGSEQWYRHGLCRNVLYTDGVKYVADTGGAYWLIDKIATLQTLPKVKGEEFQSWKLKKLGDQADLTCDDGNHNVVYRERIEFTDFPVPEITIWCTAGAGDDPNGWTLLLPSEY